MRRVGAAAVLALVLVAAPAAGARTIKVDWREQKPLADGGALKFHVTKVVATTTQWSIAATIENASGSPVGIDHDGRERSLPSQHPVWTDGIALIEPHRSWTAQLGGPLIEWWQHPATAFRPALPRTLGPHHSWTGTFGGKAKLRQGQAYSIGFGLFELQSAASGGATVFWITDHSFAL
jgi:hypothetical protein